jgi:hypothetical protein
MKASILISVQQLIALGIVHMIFNAGISIVNKCM